jgi:hypothetical protein
MRFSTLALVALLFAPARLTAGNLLADVNGLYVTQPPNQVLVRLESIGTASPLDFGLMVAQVSSSDGRYKVFAGRVGRIHAFGAPVAIVSPAYDPYRLLLDPSSLLNEDGSALVDYSQRCTIVFTAIELEPTTFGFECQGSSGTLTRLR